MTPVTPELEAMALAVAAHPSFRLLRAFDPAVLHRPVDILSDDVGYAVLLDTETTGKDSQKDHVVELGMVSFAYSRTTGQVLSALECFNGLEDPGVPIPPEATRVNGITDEMVKGQRIDDATVQAFVEKADFIVAHNAKFDRGMCERRWPFFKNKAWACSMSQVPWDEAGISSTKLEFISYRLGFFYPAHRAESDCLALLFAMDHSLEGFNGKTAMQVLNENYRAELRRIWADKAPFDAKDALKARGYSWSDGTKPDSERAWYIEVPLEAYAEELAWLKAEVYGGRSFSVPVDKVDAFNRFSDRRQKLPREYV